MKNPTFNRKWSLLEVPYTARDIEIAFLMYRKKYVRTDQIWRWSFRHASLKVCQQRLLKLHRYGILRFLEQATAWGQGRKHRIWALDRLGAELLIHERGIDPNLVSIKPRADEANNLSIKHTLATTDYQITLQDACDMAGFQLEEWVDERESITVTQPIIPLAHTSEQEVKPPKFDAFYILTREGKRGMCFLELDRATEDISLSSYERSTITGKIVEYLTWEQSEQYRQLFGARPLRVTFVTIGDRRLHNMVVGTERIVKQWVQLPPDIPDQATQADAYQEYQKKYAEFVRLGKRFRFITFANAQPATLLTQPVWQVAGCDALQTILETSG